MNSWPAVSRQAERSDVINLNFSTTPPKTPATDQTIVGLGSGIVPEGFALLAQSKTSIAVPTLPGDAAAAKKTEALTVSTDVSLATEHLAISLVQDSNVDQTAQFVVTQPTVNGPMLQLPGVANVQQSAGATDRSGSVAAEVVIDSKSIRTPTPSASISGSPVQPTAVVPTQIGQVTVEPGNLAVPVPENINQAPLKTAGVEGTGQQPASFKALNGSDTAKPVVGIESAKPVMSQILSPLQEGQQVNAANVNSGAKPAGTADPLQEMAKLVVMAPQSQSQTTNVDTKRPSDQAPLVTATAVSGVKPAGAVVDTQMGEPALQDQRAAEQPTALVDIVAKSTVTATRVEPMNGVFNPANSISTANGMNELLGLSDHAETEAVSVLASGTSTLAAKTAAPPDASLKVAPKPFAEALMAQVKSVEVSEGRTTVNLVPRGLGNIEVEVISEKDVASKVVVRVENSAVLQALRDDRHLLAQAIGVSDSSIFDFQEYGGGDQSNPQDKQGGQGSDPFGDTTATQSQAQHLDVVHEGQLDILT